MSTTEAPAVPATAPDRVPRWRRILAVILIVLSCVLTPITVMALWLHDDLLDTDGYVNTITPLAENEEILQAVSVRLTNALFENVDVETLAEENLPTRIAFLAGPLTDALEDFTQDAVLDFLQSERFRSLWEQINRSRTHRSTRRSPAAVSSSRRKRARSSSTSRRSSTAYAASSTTVASRLRRRDHRPRSAAVRAHRRAAWRAAQSAVRLLDTLRWVLPVLVLVLGAAGVLLARSRRRMLMWWGIGVVISTLVIGFGLSFGRDFYLDHLPEDTNRAAAAAAYDILVRLLRTSNRVLFAVALIVAIGAYLAGGSRVAHAVRGRTMGALDRRRRPRGRNRRRPRGRRPFRGALRGRAERRRDHRQLPHPHRDGSAGRQHGVVAAARVVGLSRRRHDLGPYRPRSTRGASDRADHV